MAVADRARAFARGAFARGAFRTQFTCACCPGKTFRGHRAMNAHHLARHGNYWAGGKARAMGRKMGKAQDAARKHARGWLEAAGLRDRNGKTTDRARSRPQVRGKAGVRDLRQLHRHDRDHERAEGHHRKADRARTPEKRADRHHQAANLRNRWPERQPQAARPVDQDRLRDLLGRAAEANGNGSRPGPERAGRPPATQRS